MLMYVKRFIHVPTLATREFFFWCMSSAFISHSLLNMMTGDLTIRRKANGMSTMDTSTLEPTSPSRATSC